MPAERPTIVVAVGAAGGVEQLERLLRELPADAEERLRAEGARIAFVEVTSVGELSDRVRAREQTLSAVRRATQYALADSPVPERLELIARELQGALETDLCAMWAYHPGTGHFTLEASAGFENGAAERACVPGGPDTLLGFALSAHGPVVMTDTASEKRFACPPVLAEEGVQSAVACVVGRDSTPVGVLTVHARQPREFGSAEVELVRSMAGLAGCVVERARLERRLALEDGAVLSLAQAEGSLDASRRLLDLVQRELDVELAELWMPSSDGEVLVCIRSLPTDAENGKLLREFSAQKMRRGEGLPGRIWASARAEWTSDLEHHTQIVRANLARKLGLRSGFGAPIVAGRDVVGVITAFSARRLVPDPDLLRTFEAIGRSVGEFIRRSRAEERRREAEERLRESERSFRMLAEAIPHMVWTALPDGTIDYCNRRTLEITGLSPEDVAPPGAWIASVHPDDRDAAKEQWHGALERGEEQHTDVRVRRASDGAWVWFSIHAVPMKDAEGRVVRWFGTSTNIQERREAEAFLREAARQKDEFLAMLSHELRNPLAAIRTAAELLALTHRGDPDLQATEAVLSRQTAHMMRLIDGLLDVSRIVHGKLTIEKSKVDVVETLRDVLDDRATHVATHRLGLRTELPHDPLWVVGDRVRLAQVFDNLVANAVNFTPPPGLITVTACRSDADVVVSVHDTGIGLREEMRTRIFEPFQQAPQGMARMTGGLGLGLALAKGILDLHGGHIEARSEGTGQGSEFVVRLPLTSPPRRRASTAARDVVAPRHLRILVVEDNEDAARLLEMLLSKDGHQVSIATTGAEGLSRMRADAPEVVLCDLGLPDMSGYDVARAVHADPALRDIQLVALTGYGRAEDRRQSEEAGFTAHVVKPVDRRHLRSVLAQVTSA